MNLVDWKPFVRGHGDCLELVGASNLLVVDDKGLGIHDLAGSCETCKVWSLVNQRGTKDHLVSYTILEETGQFVLFVLYLLPW